MITTPTREFTEISAIVEVITARLALLAVSTSKQKVSVEVITRVEEADQVLASIADGRLVKLLTLFGCRDTDRAILLTCLASQFEPALLARYTEIQGRPWATEALAARLFDLGREPLMSASSAIISWRLVREERHQIGEPPALEADPVLRLWLTGGLSIEPELQGAIELIEPQNALSGWPVDSIATHVQDAIKRGERVAISIDGLYGSGRATFAANIAKRMGQRCFIVDTNSIAEWDEEATIRAHRCALVAGAMLVWRNAQRSHLWPRGVWPTLLQAVTVESGDVPPDLARFASYHVSLPVMDREERAALLEKFAPGSSSWSLSTRRIMAERRALTPGEIKRIGRIAPNNDAMALEVVNQSNVTVMGDLACRLSSDMSWSDLVLPEEMKSDLNDLAYECRSRSEVWKNPKIKRLFGREQGLVALFQGPPGTGKTMTAQVMANELGLDLFRIDCATVTSKYIGETAKNLRKIFACARKIDAVIFFDEADALFAKRTDVKDAHDRHANADTSYLLQLIESEFEGFGILATNRTTDIDAAFIRRIRYIFDFPRPSCEQRNEIWRRSAEVLLPSEAMKKMNGLWPVLAECLDITGAQIKTTLLAAHFAAQRRNEHLMGGDIVRAVEREFAKEGRSINPREKQRISSYA